MERPDITPDWFLEAACRDADPDLFFPTKGQTADAVVRREYFGVWGGLSAEERKTIRRRDQRARRKAMAS